MKKRTRPLKEVVSSEEKLEESKSSVPKSPDQVPVIVERSSRCDLPEIEEKKMVQTRNTVEGLSGGAEPNVLEPVELSPPLPALPMVTMDGAQLLGIFQRLIESQTEQTALMREGMEDVTMGGAQLPGIFQRLIESYREQTTLMRESMEDVCRAARVTPQLKVGSAMDFKELGPLEFYGTEGILYADEWLENVERLMKIVRIPDDLKVETASIQLFDIARIWFKDEPELAVPNLTWETFKELFKKKFFPEVARDALQDQFERLEQGNLTVDEYAAEFNRLSLFVEYMIGAPEVRARRFRRGLSQEIRLYVTSIARTYEEILNVAQGVEWNLGRRPKRGRGY
ncbi:Uncharacterized protein M6B38_210015 [Iris pallida]|uniref:Retrotransposon gag domain-containing protein n=1 Tax=Iris pallida TaxID=29817 RepID=A0AAX6E3H5_IRIPA|nr:Uncharacterized protein M6B38_210015 [Iris pallida]